MFLIIQKCGNCNTQRILHVHTIIDCEFKCSRLVAEFILWCTTILPSHTRLYTADLQNGLDKSHSTFTQCFLKDWDLGRVCQYLIRVTATPEYGRKRVTITDTAQCQCVTRRKLAEVPRTNHNPSRIYTYIEKRLTSHHLENSKHNYTAIEHWLWNI